MTSFVRILSYLPIDLGQGQFKHKTKAKSIAWKNVPVALPGAKALDIGCGDGHWSEKIKTKGYTVTSVDIPREYPNEDWDAPYSNTLYADAGKELPFPDASFELVWSSEVIEHVTNFRTMLSEIERVLKPGGWAIITTPNSFFWLHHLLALVGLRNEDWQNSGHVNFFSYDDVKGFFPHTTVYGYFPYTVVKWCISYGIRLLSPSFVILYQKSSRA
jgi:ubiquinone/menaquinone biosynthesis C-methylase UbiE